MSTRTVVDGADSADEVVAALGNLYGRNRRIRLRQGSREGLVGVPTRYWTRFRDRADDGLRWWVQR